MSDEFRCNACGGVYRDLQLDGSIYHHACPPLTRGPKGDPVKNADARNENLTEADESQLPAILAEGQGVECLSTPRLTEPAWITQMKARAAQARGE